MEESQINQLLREVARGNKKSMNSLVLLYQEKALKIAYYHVGFWEDAEEIAQDAFIRVFKGVKKFQGKAKFSTWFYRILINLCHDYHRKKKRKTFVSLSETEKEGLPATEIVDEKNPRDALVSQENMEALQEAIKTLPPQQKTVFCLHYFEEQKLSEIAEVLGTSEGNIKANLFQARDKLKKILENRSVTTGEHHE